MPLQININTLIFSKMFNWRMTYLQFVYERMFVLKHNFVCNVISWNNTVFLIYEHSFPYDFFSVVENSFQSLSSSCHRVQSRTSILCMGCHPHTRVNPAQRTIRKKTQEPMWCELVVRFYFSITRKQVIQKERMGKWEWEWERVQVTHAFYTINVPLNNFNIHQHNKEGIYLIGYQHYYESHQRWSQR